MDVIALSIIIFGAFVVSVLAGATNFRQGRFFTYHGGILQVMAGFVAAVSAYIIADASLNIPADPSTRDQISRGVMIYPVYFLSAIMILFGMVQVIGKWFRRMRHRLFPQKGIGWRRQI